MRSCRIILVVPLLALSACASFGGSPTSSDGKNVWETPPPLISADNPDTELRVYYGRCIILTPGVLELWLTCPAKHRGPCK